MSKYKRKSNAELLASAKQSFQRDFNYPADLLNMQTCTKLPQLQQALRKFIEKNSWGFTSTQFRKLYDAALKAVTNNKVNAAGYRSFLAFRIVNTRSDANKEILLLLEDLAKATTPDNSQGYRQLIESMVAYHKFYEKNSGRQEAIRLGNQHFRDFAYPADLLKLNRYTEYADANTVKKLLDVLHNLLKDHAAKITPHQVRRVYGAIMDIPTGGTQQLKMLNPLLANIVGRQGTDDARKIMVLLEDLVNATQSEADLSGLQRFMELFIAYHRYFHEIKGKKETELEEVLNANLPITEAQKTWSYQKILATYEGTDYTKLNAFLATFVKKTGKDLSSSQLRNIYDKVLKTNDFREVQLLRPIIAYSIIRAKRDDSKILLLFILNMARATTAKNYENFKFLLQTIVAYHEYYDVVSA